MNSYSIKKRALPILKTLAVLLLVSVAPVCAQGADPVVELQTSKGNIYIRVFRGLAPRTSMNFLDLVSRGFYNGTYFHRVETWCVQGGSPNGDPNGNFVDPATGRPRFIPLEVNRSLAHSRAGVVAMARTSNPNSASCQFYITKKPMRQLDGQYAIFGSVVQGLNSVQSMGRGDQILSARVIQINSGSNQTARQQNTGNPNVRGGRSGRSRQSENFEPPTDIPDSGF